MYLQGLASLTKMDLLLYFSKYGQIKNVEIDTDTPGQGHIEFDSMEQVKKAYQDGLASEYSARQSCHRVKDVIFQCNLDKKFEVNICNFIRQ